jgi:D-serine deaminase-like pyridoxal phosphate-dependent protein
VDQAAGAASGASDLLVTYQPIAERAAPLARKFVEEFSEEEVRAAVRMVDQLPQLTEHLETDIMPILATLDRVGPDVHELLEQLKEVRQAIQGIPGFGFFRRRGERDDGEENGVS